MPPSAIHKKGALSRAAHGVQLEGAGKNAFIVRKLVIFVTLLGILAPVSASAADPMFAATINGVPQKFQGLAACKAAGGTIRTCKPIQEATLEQTETAGGAATWATLAAKKAALPVTEAPKSSGFITGALYAVLSPVLIPLAGIAYMVFKVAGIFLTVMAKIMDFSISVTIDSSLYGALEFVNIGWTAVRDFANMFFIFALLYIAIQTILGLAGGNAKRALAHLIIAAILINFSLFATKVVIDAGNILGVSIWDKIKTQQGPDTLSSASTKILGGLDLQTVFEKAKVASIKNYLMNADVLIVVYAGGAIFMFIAGYILLAGALMMVTRTVMLILLMIFSPFAFMAFGLPKFETYGHQWLDKLIKQTIVAPFFIFMLYLNAKMVDNFDIFKISQSKGGSFADALVGNGSFEIIFNFILMISFLIASLHIANSFAGGVGSHAQGWAKTATKWAGGMAVGGAVAGTAWGMRQSLGKVGMMNKDNEELHRKAAEGGLGGAWARGKIAMYGGMARASYDARGTKYGQQALSGGGRIKLGEAGGKGGREATGRWLGTTMGVDLLNKGDVGENRKKEVLELAERRYKNDPAGKAAYLKANLGTMVDKKTGKRVNRYENDTELKATREAVATEQRQKDSKDTIKTAPDEIDKLEAAITDLKKRGADTRLVVEAETKLTNATNKLAKAWENLNGKEGAEMINDEAFAKNPHLMRYVTQQQVAYVNANSDKYTPEVMKKMNEGAMQEGSPAVQGYLIRQAQLKTSNFRTNLADEIKKADAAYKNERDTFDENTADEETLGKHYDTLDKLDGLKQDILGAMTAKEVARLDDKLKEDESMVRNYKAKHFDEIGNYHKKIKRDADTPEKKAHFAKIRENAKKHGTQETLRYMRKAERDPESVYYDPSARGAGGGDEDATEPEEEGVDDGYGNLVHKDGTPFT